MRGVNLLSMYESFPALFKFPLPESEVFNIYKKSEDLHRGSITSKEGGLETKQFWRTQ